MGQSHGVLKRYRHHLDPIALNASTLPVREHMFGESDLVLVVRGVRFPVNKAVLVEHSAYFRSMLTGFQERFEDEVALGMPFEPALLGQVARG